MAHLEELKKKILTNQTLEQKLLEWRNNHKKIVFTNGCFDIIHQGHIDYLSKAADLGDILFIGLNSNYSVSRLKGDTRPINDEFSRAVVLASMSFVTALVVFDEDTPYQLIKKVDPDILVKGADYSIEEIIGHDIVQAKGGKVIRIKYLEGFSTSAIEKKIKG